MAERCSSWVFDGTSANDPQIQSWRQIGSASSSEMQNNGHSEIEMKTMQYQCDDIDGKGCQDADDERNVVWSRAKQGQITRWLVFCTVTVTFASSIPFGYNAGCITANAPFIRTFLNESQWDRGGIRFGEGVLGMLWSFTEAGFRFGGAMGSQSGGQIAKRLGRKKGFLIQYVISIFACIMLGVTTLVNSWELLLFGRLLIGIGTGMGMTIVPLYLAEISPTIHRGTIGSLHFFMFAIGLLIAQGISFFPLHSEELWPLALALGGVFNIIGLLTVPFCPESPRHLAITMGANDEAEKVLQRLRGNDADISDEMREMQRERDLEKRRGVDGLVNTICCRAPGWKTPVYMALLLLVTQQIAVTTAFTFNALETWRSTALPDETLIFYAIIGSDALIAIAAILPVFVSDSWGRKRLVTYGYGCCVLCLISLTVFLSLQKSTGEDWMFWGNLLSIYCFVTSFSIGPGSVPFIIVPEMFTQSPRTYAVAISNQMYWLSSLIMAFLYPVLLDILGTYVFTVFIVLMLPPIVCIYKYLPETKQNTFVENASLFMPPRHEIVSADNPGLIVEENESTNETKNS